MPLKILIADDVVDTTTLLTVLLKRLGHSVHTANDGEEALELAQLIRPDVLLMDIGMPRKNGYEVAEAIRAEDWGHEISLIALSGQIEPETQARARQAGFDTFLLKPVDVDALRAALGSIPGRGATAG